MMKTMLRAALIATTTISGGTLLLPTAASAQAGQASLRGTITAPTDNPATQVTLVEVATNYRRVAAVAADGTYNFASVRAGVYRLEITLRNGTRNSDEFTLRVGQNAGLDLDLSTAPAAQPATESTAGGVESSGDEIVVTGSRLRSLSGGQVGINITQRLIEQLPQNSRNFLAFADLAPGVRFLEGSNGEARIQGGAQRSSTVNVFIDGVSQKDFVLKNGITGQDTSAGNPFPQLAIGEYQVLSSNYKAELDQVSSVAIIAGTKSGTNEFHGEAFFDYTDEKLRDKRPSEIYPTDIAKVKTVDKQFGAALGGPIIKDVMHFFGSYEGKRREFPVDINPNNSVAVSSLPSQYQGLFGTATATFREDLYFGKIDIVPTDRDLIEFTGKYRDESGFNLNNGFATVSTGTNTKVVEKRGTARWQHTADNFINDLRVSYEDVRWAPTPNTFANGQLFQATRRTGTAVSRFDIFRTGGGSNYQDKGQKGWTVQDDFTWTGIDSHTIKVGAKVKWVTLRTLEQNLFNPLYTYDTNLFSQTGFNDTLPYRVQFGARGTFGTPIVESKNFQFGIYAQDDWDVNDRLTLNLGIRWDYERTPSYLDFVTPAENLAAVSPTNYPNLTRADYNINDFISNGSNRKAFKGAFQPRLGFTYRIDEAGRFTVFGGYGRSYDRNQFDFLQQEQSVGAFPVRTFQFIGNNSLASEACNPVNNPTTCVAWDPIYLTQEGRARLAANAVGGGRELRFIDNDLKTPYSDQFSLGLRSRFGALEVETGYTHISSRDGFAFLLGNRRTDGSFFFDNPASATDVPGSPFGFAPPGYNSIIIGTNGLESNSDAGYVKLTKVYSAASPWSIDATYTYTQAEENRQFGETFSLDYASLKDYPFLISSGVPRHRFVIAGSTDTPIGISLSAKFQIESPLYKTGFVNTAAPFARTIVGTFQDSNGDRWGRRQLDLAATKYVPLRFLTEESRLRFRVDIINLMNDRNYVDFNGDPLSPLFGQRSSQSIGGNPPRTIKLSAGFSF